MLDLFRKFKVTSLALKTSLNSQNNFACHESWKTPALMNNIYHYIIPTITAGYPRAHVMEDTSCISHVSTDYQ